MIRWQTTHMVTGNIVNIFEDKGVVNSLSWHIVDDNQKRKYIGWTQVLKNCKEIDGIKAGNNSIYSLEKINIDNEYRKKGFSKLIIAYIVLALLKRETEDFYVTWRDTSNIRGVYNTIIKLCGGIQKDKQVILTFYGHEREADIHTLINFIKNLSTR
ncbi:hypothetical protein [Macrococcus carouselicus]|uniref:Uncharacterized protein n=1 Tax=Macrococcus carouselicus TaxID=69969 RepID=A0A9Q8CKQ0_9STAP|nr:hypothetical protein [Macrococcus carouselicus]TDL95523.1 hypothetical protein ERX40_10090 [Macrococcus carouselicus]